MNKEEPSSQIPTHYEVLGLNHLNPNDVTPDIIKKAYRMLSFKHHPERLFAILNREPNQEEKYLAEVKMRALNSAKDTLLDPYDKAQYDLELKLRVTKQNVVEVVEDPEDVVWFRSIIWRNRREGIEKVSQFDTLNIMPLDELEAWEKVFRDYQGRIKVLFIREFAEFSSILQEKRAFPHIFWTVLKEVRNNKSTYIPEKELFISLKELLKVKSSWKIYKGKYPVGKIFEEQVNAYLEKAEAKSTYLTKNLQKILMMKVAGVLIGAKL